MRANDRLDLRIISCGEHSIIVVDNFFANPWDVVKLAESLDYSVEESRRQFRSYPGERASISVSMRGVMGAMLRAFSDGSGRSHALANYYDKPIVFTRMNSHIMGGLHPRQIVPHVDLGFELTGLVYLSSSEVGGGTGFYRHQESALDYLPHEPSPQVARIMRQYGFNPFADEDYRNFTRSLMYQGIDRADHYLRGGETGRFSTALKENEFGWQLQKAVKLEFNRMIIFPATMFHSPMYEGSVGADDVEARLTFNAFFERRR